MGPSEGKPRHSKIAWFLPLYNFNTAAGPRLARARDQHCSLRSVSSSLPYCTAAHGRSRLWIYVRRQYFEEWSLLHAVEVASRSREHRVLSAMRHQPKRAHAVLPYPIIRVVGTQRVLHMDLHQRVITSGLMPLPFLQRTDLESY